MAVVHELVRWRITSRLVLDAAAYDEFHGCVDNVVQNLHRLSRRELQIATLAALAGQTNQAIALALEISPATVRVHLRHVRGKLELLQEGSGKRRWVGAVAFVLGMQSGVMEG